MGFTLSTPDAQYRIDSLAALSPAMPQTPGMFEGTGSAVGQSIIGGVGDVAHTGSAALSASARANAEIGLIENPWADPTGEGLAQLRAEPVQKPPFDEALTQLHQWSQLDPATQGGGARVLGSTARALTVVGTGSLLGGPVAGAGTLGATDGYNTLRDTQAQGVDQTTALKMAGLSAVTSFGGAFLPMKIGSGAATSLAGLGMKAELAGNEALASTLYGTARIAASATSTTAGKLATGAAINTGFGVSDRFATSSLLDSAGYKEMAAQYQPIDSEALVADLILGAAFGLHGHVSEKIAEMRAGSPTSSLIESALASRRQEMIARGGAGVPIDPMHANLDATLQDNALSDLLHGRDVSVAPEHAASIIEGAVPDPVRTTINDAFVGRMEEAHGLLADFTEPTRVPDPVPTAMDVARLSNTFTGQAPGAGQSVGMTQPKGTPVEKLFSNFADAALPKTWRDMTGQGRTREQVQEENLTKFRASMLQRALAEPKQFAKDALTTNDYQFPGGRIARVEAAASGNTRVTVREGDRTVAAARLSRGMIDSIASDESVRGKGVGVDLLRFLDRERIANVDEVPDRSPGFVAAQKKVIGERGDAQPEFAQPLEKGAAISPLAQESLRQLAASRPDMQVELGNGQSVAAADLPKLIARELTQAEGDSKLHDVAMACFMRTQ